MATLSHGKLKRMKALANDSGVIAAAAMDQRGSLQKSLAKAKGIDKKEVTYEMMAEFKTAVTKILTPHASAILLDPEYGMGATRARSANAGLLRTVLDTIRATPGIARVFVGEQLASVDANADDRFERAAKWSYFPGRSGDLIVVQRPYWLSASDATTSTGTGHGSPYSYDQRVPLFLFGQGIKRGEQLSPAGPMDIAPTLAYLCGITLPAADGRVLDEALVAASRAVGGRQ